jgi:low-affinity inorganic phosphate transporter
LVRGRAASVAIRGERTGRGLAMVLSLLGAAIIWNFATWYRGLPASSSHSLIGSIMGVGMMNSLLEHGSLAGGLYWLCTLFVG